VSTTMRTAPSRNSASYGGFFLDPMNPNFPCNHGLHATRGWSIPIPVPSVTRWSVDDLEGAQAAATLVVGLHQTVQEDRTPGWLTADVLKRWAADPGPRASVYDRALILRAYLLLGGHADESMVSHLASQFRAHRGCPGLPGLYRPDDEPGCDLKTTWAVWELDKALDRKLGTLPSQGS
ncbi:hypothetical protein LJ657_47920, partial [Streptomyces sp. NR30]|nr:hypothetical protein [Streptomyces guryensis]